MLATVVDTKVLAEIVGASFAAGIGVTLIFSLVIYGGTRFADLRRDGNPVGAAMFAAAAIVCFLAFVAAVVLGIAVMTSK
jgi:hypothetical protein